ncbi:hypothetical protein ACGVWS_05750 [Enterobacteriaceae bacterium LUAb1]
MSDINESGKESVKEPVKEKHTPAASIKKADPVQWVKTRCPAIFEALQGKDSLLEETAESTLSWVVLGVQGANLEFVARSLGDMAEPPILLLEKAEERFLELRKIVIKARGDADLSTIAEERLKEYAGNIHTAMNKDDEDHRIKKAAEQALSAFILGKKGADYAFIKKYVADNIQKKEDAIIDNIKQAELNFIDTRTLISSIISDFKNEEKNGVSSIIKSIQFGISRYNILFVLLLIVGLGWSAINLPQQALALVSASIGAAISHLLAERNAVLGQKQSRQEKEQRDS